MSGWLKDDGVPFWWPPKLDQEWRPDRDTLDVRIAKAVGGWLAFVTVYGLAIFALTAVVVLVAGRV